MLRDGVSEQSVVEAKLTFSFSSQRPRPGVVGRMVLIGEVENKVAILVDDMADTCGTLDKAASLLREANAKEILAIATRKSPTVGIGKDDWSRRRLTLKHATDGILSGSAIDTINNGCLSRVIVTNTVPLGEKLERCPKLQVIDVSATLGEAIRRTHNGESVSYLFTHVPV